MHRTAHLALLLAGLWSLLLPRALRADDLWFAKTHIDSEFHSEGVAVADVDGDSRLDLLAGGFWYRAPDWKRYEIAPPKKFVPEKGYSDSFCCFSEDLSGDGRPDLIVVGFPGAPVRVYENPGPGGYGRHWKAFEAFANCSNETPLWVDVDGDGKREIVCGSSEKRMWLYSPGEKISEPWRGRPISAPNAVGADRFSHGLGVGDLDRDGRNDVLVNLGWYRQPESGADGKPWEFRKGFPPAPIHVIETDPRDPSKLLTTRPTGRDCADMRVWDFDADGDRDVVASSAHCFGIWWIEQRKEADGATRWVSHSIDESYSQHHALILADINEDGLPDLVTGKRWYAHQGHDPGGDKPAVLSWYELRRGEQPTWIRHHIDSSSGVGTQFVVSDIDGDGHLDIAISNKRGVFVFHQRRRGEG